jgi:hypothetical protein
VVEEMVNKEAYAVRAINFVARCLNSCVGDFYGLQSICFFLNCLQASAVGETYSLAPAAVTDVNGVESPFSVRDN